MLFGVVAAVAVCHRCFVLLLVVVVVAGVVMCCRWLLLSVGFVRCWLFLVVAVRFLLFVAIVGCWPSLFSCDCCMLLHVVVLGVVGWCRLVCC